MEKVFRLKERGTTIRKEVLGGVITFVSMVYILAVNPSILSAAGMDPAAVFTATAISAVRSTRRFTGRARRLTGSTTRPTRGTGA